MNLCVIFDKFWRINSHFKAEGLNEKMTLESLKKVYFTKNKSKNAIFSRIVYA